MVERMYRITHDKGKVQKGGDHSFEQSAPKVPACLPGVLELGMLMVCQYNVYE